ncbi:hypothetical protein [Hyphobacterium sp.]|uniref:hypothetical protein n=1 Tax=Hyphobacterium sp. TaxID=2004662 RepID=UPI003BAA2859
MAGIRTGLLIWVGIAITGFLPACASQDEGITEAPGSSVAAIAQRAVQDEAVPVDGIAAGLPPQELLPGECGAFFWDRAEPNALRLFENESRGLARYWTGSGVDELNTGARPFAYRPGDRIRREYGFATGTIRLEGEISGLRDGEAVISRALLRIAQSDGTQIVRPLVGLISCQPESAGH